MSTWDLVAIGLYLMVVVGAGLHFRKRASQDLESYFLGGRRIHWLALSMSASVSTFDITGTMWMVSVLVLLGMSSWWHHWMWGVALPAFALAYMGRWVRRSGVMTAAEWMITRFGTDAGGRAARYATALTAVVFTAAAVGYAFQGIGKFLIVYFPPESLAAVTPLSEEWARAHGADLLAVLVLAMTTVYVMAGGLLGVVVTDVIQTVLLSGAALWIVVLAWQSIPAGQLEEVLPSGFTSLVPVWRRPELAGTEHADYEMIGLLTMVWVAKGLLMNLGGPSQQYDCQRFLAAADERDAAKIAAAWPFFLVLRWAMVMGIALLALTGVLATGDPEQVMPRVLQEHLPDGVRGLVLAGLLAAFMSTFSSTLNAGAAFVVRDLWQPWFRPDAGQRQLVRASAWATLGLVVVGVLIGMQARSIGHIWSWMMMALSAGGILPNLLRWYWWRLNGWGYAAGVVGGVLLSLIALFLPEAPIYVVFPIVCLGSALGCVVGSLWTAPTDDEVLVGFFRQVRPFGAWGVVRAQLDPAEPVRGDSAVRSLGNAFLAIGALTALYLGPMYALGRWYGAAVVCAVVFAGCAVALWFTWYRPFALGAQNLASPPRNQPCTVRSTSTSRPVATPRDVIDK